MRFELGDALFLGELIRELLEIQKIYGSEVIVDAIVFEPDTGHFCVASEIPEGHAMYCSCEAEPAPPPTDKTTTERVTKNGKATLRVVK